MLDWIPSAAAAGDQGMARIMTVGAPALSRRALEKPDPANSSWRATFVPKRPENLGGQRSLRGNPIAVRPGRAQLALLRETT
jgi:hypothetical protein